MDGIEVDLYWKLQVACWLAGWLAGYGSKSYTQYAIYLLPFLIQVGHYSHFSGFFWLLLNLLLIPGLPWKLQQILLFLIGNEENGEVETGNLISIMANAAVELHYTYFMFFISLPAEENSHCMDSYSWQDKVLFGPYTLIIFNVSWTLFFCEFVKVV